MPPTFVAQAGKQATFAHEMGHSFGVHHAPCPPLGSANAPPWPHDSRLPGGTEETGMDVSQHFVIRRNTSEIMSYCALDSRWPSIAFWDVIFDTLPI